MGGREFDYNSDLDLVFVYAAPEDAISSGSVQGKLPAHDFYVRVGQKLLTYLSAPTEEGIAYKIDMQLRPSGKSGPIVSSVDAFRDYHRTASELWERQALIKTGFIAGDTDPRKGSRANYRAVCVRHRSPPDGIAEIHHLRKRMERELAGEDDTHFNLKKGRGGLVDIEFLTQMLQLTHGYRLPALRRRERSMPLASWSCTTRKSSRRRNISCSPKGTSSCAESITVCAWNATNRSIPSKPIRAAWRASPEHSAMPPLKNASKPTRSQSGTKLLRDYQNRRERIRACYERYFNSQPNS